MALLIDTDLLVELEQGRAATDDVLGDEDCAIRCHHGQRATPRSPAGKRRDPRARRRAFVEHLLAGHQAIPISAPVARIHADVWSELAGRGESIGAHDLWIAATAITHGMGLATSNRADFERVPGLRLVSSPR